MSLEKILERIQQDAQSEVDKIKSRASAAAAKILKKAQEEAEILKKQAQEDSENEAKQRGEVPPEPDRNGRDQFGQRLGEGNRHLALSRLQPLLESVPFKQAAKLPHSSRLGQHHGASLRGGVRHLHRQESRLVLRVQADGSRRDDEAGWALALDESGA